MKRITITAKYEIAESIARFVRTAYRVVGEATIGKREPEAEVTKRLYLDDLQPGQKS